MSGSVERFSDSGDDALARAQLVREIAAALSGSEPLENVLDRCAELLSDLTGGGRVRIVWRERGIEAVVSDRARALPIRFGNSTLGLICIDGAPRWDPQLQALLESCALHVGARLYHEQIVASSERYAHLALTDALTGIANRRKFDERLVEEWRRARRDASPLSLVIIDLDYFKNFNDTYGHQGGDRALIEVARALQTCAERPADLVARYGGEEFVALLPATGASGAIALAEKLRAAVSSMEIAHEGSSLGHVSASIGVATRVPAEGAGPEELFDAADEALYRAKLGGRNRVSGEGYESDAPAARRRASYDRTNLPSPLTPLVGRAKELAEIRSLAKAHRLLTIVGAGGSGKTRTAIAAASALYEEFEDGTWFVDLAPLRDPELTAVRIGAAFRAEIEPGSEAISALAAAIGEKRMMLVVDNAEHVLQGAAQTVAALLSACPRLHVVVTSREPLAQTGENVYWLPLLAPADAFDLFVQRLKASRHDFEVTPENARTISDLCARVDRLALAIELVASRSALVGLDRIAAGMQLNPAEQRTMQAAIDWSYDALSDEEREAFRRLSVFAGGFAFDDALEVCAAAPHALEALIRKSLIASDLGRAGRYRLLEVMREYAYAKLCAAGETQAYARRHAELFSRVAATADRSFSRAQGPQWFERFKWDVDNFRAALRWTLEEGNDPALGAKIVSAANNLFDNLHPAEATRWTTTAIRVAGPALQPETEARLWLNLVSGSRNLPAKDLRDAAERSVHLYRGLDDPYRLSDALRALAQIIGWYFRDERETADALACESIAIARTLENPLHLATCLRTRGLTIDIADLPAKRAVLEESLQLMRRHGNERQLGTLLTWISEFEFSAGNTRRAYEYGREAVRVAEVSAAPQLIASTAGNLSRYAAALGEWDLARRSASTCLRMSRENSQPEQFTFAVQTFADIAEHDGDVRLAARLLGFCNARCGVLHPHRQADQSEDVMYKRLIARLEAALTNLAEELAAGARLSEEDVLAAIAV